MPQAGLGICTGALTCNVSKIESERQKPTSIPRLANHEDDVFTKWIESHPNRGRDRDSRDNTYYSLEPDRDNSRLQRNSRFDEPGITDQNSGRISPVGDDNKLGDT